MTAISFEYFPPKSAELRDRLRLTADRLAVFEPSHVSVTHGAAGSNRQRTYETVADFHARGYTTMAHLTCIGSKRAEVAALLHDYAALGIRRLIALRGDLPPNAPSGDFAYASDLVAFIRAETGSYFSIDVAAYPEGHPQAANWEVDFYRLCQKFWAGADSATTQYFYNADDYFRLVDALELAGISAPVTPGIMPITTLANLQRFSDFCGATVPRWLSDRLAPYINDPVGTREVGTQILLELCDRLITGGAPGLHFYTLNQLEPTRSVLSLLATPLRTAE